MAESQNPADPLVDLVVETVVERAEGVEAVGLELGPYQDLVVQYRAVVMVAGVELAPYFVGLELGHFERHLVFVEQTVQLQPLVYRTPVGLYLYNLGN